MDKICNNCKNFNLLMGTCPHEHLWTHGDHVCGNGNFEPCGGMQENLPGVGAAFPSIMTLTFEEGEEGYPKILVVDVPGDIDMVVLPSPVGNEENSVVLRTAWRISAPLKIKAIFSRSEPFVTSTHSEVTLGLWVYDMVLKAENEYWYVDTFNTPLDDDDDEADND